MRGTIKLNLTMTGSVLAETIRAGSSSIETNFEVDSDEDPETIRSLLRMARNACWARQMVADPVTFNDSLTLKGTTLQF